MLAIGLTALVVAWRAPSYAQLRSRHWARRMHAVTCDGRMLIVGGVATVCYNLPTAPAKTCKMWQER